MEELDAFEKRLRAVLEEGTVVPAVDLRAAAMLAAAGRRAARRWAWLRWAGCAAAAGLVLVCGWFWLAGRGAAEEDGVPGSILLLSEMDEVEFEDSLEEAELLLAWQDAPYDALWENLDEL